MKHPLTIAISFLHSTAWKTFRPFPSGIAHFPFFNPERKTKAQLLQCQPLLLYQAGNGWDIVFCFHPLSCNSGKTNNSNKETLFSYVSLVVSKIGTIAHPEFPCAFSKASILYVHGGEQSIWAISSIWWNGILSGKLEPQSLGLLKSEAVAPSFVQAWGETVTDLLCFPAYIALNPLQESGLCVIQSLFPCLSVLITCFLIVSACLLLIACWFIHGVQIP